jgi:hypothetical protein
MINDGAIYVGKKVKDRKGHGGTAELEDVYANIYFKDMHNISHFWDVSVVLHPKILHEYDAVFNLGWGSRKNSVFFYKTDTPKEFNEKLDKVRELIKNPHTIPKIVQDAPGMLHHEVTFPNDIPLKDNLLGIVCNHCPNKDISKIKNALKDNSYKNVMILDRNYPFPSLSEFLEYIEKNN